MRPERGVVKKALLDAQHNKRRAAALLGCTPQSLYTWIYQYGLEDVARVRSDARAFLDARERQDTLAPKEKKTTVYSGGSVEPNLHVVEPQAQNDAQIIATFRVRESVWREVKIASIRRGITMAEYVESTLRAALAPAAEKPRKAKGEKP
jgi:hypothetical protein